MKKNRLHNLMLANRTAPRAFRAEAGAGEATIYLYDIIGEDFWTGEGVTARRFMDALATIDAPVIHLRINSPGGDVFEARTITALMDAHPATFIAHIDGLAASAASFIAARADEVEIADGAFVMIHNAWTMAMGDRHDFLDQAALLEKVDASIAADYVKRMGAELEQVAAWMDAETWFTSDEAVANGFANRLAPKASAPAPAAAWNLAAYDKAPANLTAPATAAAPTDPVPSAHAAELEHRLRVLRLAETEPA